MRYFLVEPKDSHSTRLKALLVVAETPQEALSYVPQESQDTYRVTGQSGKGIDLRGWSRRFTITNQPLRERTFEVQTMTARILRFLGRFLCDLGLHNYRLTEKSIGFTAGPEVTYSQCRRCGRTTTTRG